MKLTLIARAFYDTDQARNYVGHHHMNEFARVVIDNLDKAKDKELFVAGFIMAAEALWKRLNTKGQIKDDRAEATSVT